MLIYTRSANLEIYVSGSNYFGACTGETRHLFLIRVIIRTSVLTAIDRILSEVQRLDFGQFSARGKVAHGAPRRLYLQSVLGSSKGIVADSCNGHLIDQRIACAVRAGLR